MGRVRRRMPQSQGTAGAKAKEQAGAGMFVWREMNRS